MLFGFIFAIGESLGFLAEYMIVGGLIQTFSAQAFSFYTPFGTNKICQCDKTSIISCILCYLNTDKLIIFTSLVHFLLATFLTVYWFLWRYGVQIKKRLTFKFSNRILIVFILSVIGLIFLLLIQYQTNTWIYSTSNFIVEECDEKTNTCETAIAYFKILQLLIASPIIEEVVLRVILFTLYLSSLLFTNISFSALHLVNLLRGSSVFYSIFQITMAVIIGLFYSTRYYITYNLYEIVSLHMLNNLFAIIIPIDLDSKVLYPWFYLSILYTILTYLTLLIFDVKEILQSEEEENQQQIQTEEPKKIEIDSSKEKKD
eukprot:gene1274-11361_t